MNENKTLSTRSYAPSESVPALRALLEDLIRQRRDTYATSNALIHTNRANTTDPARRLRLPMDKLVEHGNAVEARRRAQRELMVVVPLHRRLLVGIKKNDSFDDKASPIVAFLRKHIAIRVGWAQWSKHHDESELVGMLQAAFPALLGPVAEKKPAPAPRAPVEPSEKFKLYQKLLCSELLNDAERTALRDVFWGDPGAPAQPS